MTAQRNREPHRSPMSDLFPSDRRDRRPGTHFAAELGGPSRAKKKPLPGEIDPHVDEDLGVSEFGIDLPFLRR
jgi:hypothetical protein